MVPIECAAELGEAIIAAGKGEPFGVQPEWWEEFEEQYEALGRASVESDHSEIVEGPG